MIIKRQYEIERCVSKDKSREHIAHAHLDVRGHQLVATNGHMMAVAPVQAEEGDTSGPVTAPALKAARQAAKVGGRDTAQLGANGTLAVDEGHGPSFPRPIPALRFPEWVEVVRGTRGREGVCRIGLNASYLLEIAKAIGAGAKSDNGALNVQLEIAGELDPILVTCDGEAFGVLMPCRV